ncbi:MAG TPA: aldo/keto reductase [Solirubrobacteraceae bacterium]|jgi:aryl-alcohol dehydrogenase-like predicted oxidoreductase|nr:aldo/keto reductase [Solirubrobacteraceae bacterium]
MPTEALEIEQRPLGSSGKTIPRIALGCGNFGGIGSAPAFFGQGLSDEQAMELMDAAWATGITHFDTADAYGGGRSELAIGRWISTRRLRPTITTKTFNPMADGGDHGLDPERIGRQLDSSLDRLGVDHVELYLAHEFDPDTPVQHTVNAFEALVAMGEVGAYGASNFDAAQLQSAIEAGNPQAIQNNHSLLERGDEAEVLPLCAERGVAYVVFSPLAGGWLTGKYRRGEQFPGGSRMTQRPEPYEKLFNDRTFDALDQLSALGRERNTSMAGVALAWLLADDRIAQVVIGPGRPEHLEPVREALHGPLTSDERSWLDTIFDLCES